MIKKVIFFIFTFHFFFSASTFSQEQTPEEINTIISNVQKKIHHSDYYESSYTVYAEQIENTSGISRLIWQYNMAELLFYYWRDHKSAISQRTAVASEQDTDFKSWDSYTFMTVINGYYVSIFEQTGILQKTPLEKYNILFDQTLYQIYRPTLYDVIAQSALYFYTYAEWEDSQYPLFFVDSSYFSDNVQFFNIELNVKDTSSFRYATIKLYQKLTAFHLNDINPLALIDITLNRLNYIRICSKDSMAGFLHEKALLRMVEKYIDKNGYADICYQLGLLYFKRAGFYKQEKDTNASQNLHTAVEWLQQVITQDSQAHLTDNAKALIKVIQEKSIQISFQESLPANQPNLMEVTYRNCDSLFIRIFPIVDYFSDRRNNRDRYDSLLQREYLFQWEYALIDHHDFKQNKGEIILPPLPSGNYFLLASSNRFKKEQNEGYDISVIQVSNLAYSKEEKQVKKRVLLYDRMKGNPVGRANFHAVSYTHLTLPTILLV